jgi:hypothetical protein
LACAQMSIILALKKKINTDLLPLLLQLLLLLLGKHLRPIIAIGRILAIITGGNGRRRVDGSRGSRGRGSRDVCTRNE